MNGIHEKKFMKTKKNSIFFYLYTVCIEEKRRRKNKAKTRIFFCAVSCSVCIILCKGGKNIENKKIFFLSHDHSYIHQMIISDCQKINKYGINIMECFNAQILSGIDCIIIFYFNFNSGKNVVVFG